MGSTLKVQWQLACCDGIVENDTRITLPQRDASPGTGSHVSGHSAKPRSWGWYLLLRRFKYWRFQRVRLRKTKSYSRHLSRHCDQFDPRKGVQTDAKEKHVRRNDLIPYWCICRKFKCKGRKWHNGVTTTTLHVSRLLHYLKSFPQDKFRSQGFGWAERSAFTLTLPWCNLRTWTLTPLRTRAGSPGLEKQRRSASFISIAAEVIRLCTRRRSGSAHWFVHRRRTISHKQWGCLMLDWYKQ